MRSTPHSILLLLLIAALNAVANSRILFAGDLLSLTAIPPEGEAFTLGKLTVLSFEIQNKSEHVVVVESVIPMSYGNEPILLSSTVYGSVWKEESVDEYRFNEMNQQATHLPFHAGLLLPGEKLVVSSRHRPVARREEFEILYHTALHVYDGRANSMQPFNIYVPAGGPSHSGEERYVPFTVERWREVAKEIKSISLPGPDNSPRSVLIPGLTAKPISLKKSVAFQYEGHPFYLEEATDTASRISGKTPNLLRLAFSSVLNGYVVFEKDRSWALTSKEQKERGKPFTLFPAIMLKDMDSSEYIRVRMGDEQAGFGPTEHKSSKIFWGTYPTYYGDGMYTRGEFLHLNKKQVFEFLQSAKERGYRLGAKEYFFGSRYYTLAALNNKTARPKAPADANPSRTFGPGGTERRAQ
jgi:hypothetical protein